MLLQANASKSKKRRGHRGSTGRRSLFEQLETRALLAANPIRPEFRVNTETAASQTNSAIAMNADGDYVVAWQSNLQDGSGDGIYLQRYTALGQTLGSELRVNTFTTGTQRNPAVAMDADGDFIVAWQSYGQDGSGNGVYAQRYNASGMTQGGEFRVNATTLLSQGTPSVAMDVDGDFVIAWSSVQDGSTEVSMLSNTMNRPRLPDRS